MTDATRSRRATDTPTPSDSPAGQRSAREALPAVAALSDSCAVCDGWCDCHAVAIRCALCESIAYARPAKRPTDSLAVRR